MDHFRRFRFGPTVGVESLSIKNWLEIEIGTGPMFGNGIREWDTDILFKKPFTLSQGGIYGRRRAAMGFRI